MTGSILIIGNVVFLALNCGGGALGPPDVLRLVAAMMQMTFGVKGGTPLVKMDQRG